MGAIILPTRSRKLPDPHIAPIWGNRGPCALCRSYSDLTDNHVPPEGVGNFGSWMAQSYLTASAADKELFYGRKFRGGIRFRTICRDCNSSLGGTEDKELIRLYEQAQKFVNSSLIVPSITTLSIRPNLIARGLFAHMVSANDNGVPCPFDIEARDIFFSRRPLRFSSWNLFYWVYEGDEIFVMRSAFLATATSPVQLHEVYIVKAPPLAFMFARRPNFCGLPNMMNYIQSRDQDEVEVPIVLGLRDPYASWPVVAYGNQFIMLGGASYGVIAQKY